jgi:primary-amine oxidase
MSRRRSPAYLALGLIGILVVLTAAPAQPVPLKDGEDVPIDKSKKEKKAERPKKGRGRVVQESPSHELIQSFPCDLTGKPAPMPVTSWKVHWATRTGNGLYLKGAWFKRAQDEDWIEVLGDVRLAEAFVPYHKGSPRFWDVSYNFHLDPMTRDDAGPFGQLLFDSPKAKRPTVVKEIRDRGIMYKRAGKVRRGQTLALWASLDAANYRYLIEYGFQDNGSITFRLGASGYNFGGSEFVPHMHNSLWRIDVNLGGKNHNSVDLCEHIEPDNGDRGKARTEHTPLETECGLDWDPYKFTMLRVIDTQKKNARGEPVSYYLMPQRMGNSRHYGKDKREECTLHDFWVTPADPKEMAYTQLPTYVKQGRPVVDADVVLWYNAPAHHEPRSEDGEMVNGSFTGATHVMWSSFELRPANLFDRTPFYP